MKIEKIIKSLKRDYEGIHPSSEITKYGWGALLGEIEAEEEKKYFFRNSSFSRILITGFISLALFLVFGYGVFEKTSKALPGQLLYPLKHLTEVINTQIFKKTLPKIDNKEEKMQELLKKETTTKVPDTATESSKEEFKETRQNSQNTDDRKNSREVIKKEEKPNQGRATGDRVKGIEDSVETAEHTVQQGVQNENNSTDHKKEKEEIEKRDSLKNDIESIIKSLQK